MELLVVISIILILVSVILPQLNSAREAGRRANAEAELRNIVNAFTILYDDTGFYPNGADSYCRTTVPGSNEVNLSTAAAGLVSNGSSWTGWGGPYLSSVTDPWGNPYYLDEDYQCFASTTGCNGVEDSGTDSSVIVSCGPNGTISGSSCDYDTDNIVYRLCDT